MDTDTLLHKMTQELRRGSLSLAVMLAFREEHYAYSLRKYLGEHGLAVDEGTLYPLVRRLEKDALLESEWRESSGRKRRFYQLSELGHALLPQLEAEWRSLADSVDRIRNAPKENHE
ncbi:PadR family transcriptional regulator [Simiduia aestuariiviva]|uniref:PadR family transcriptional regulator PadR n=1 Tax=Simiduia aestuariiviva TaxID=1510459 RepID=A0A839UL87_9GAMM|nr:helix-turn-helix transcriptional regulator [Simiduia aestuariiviva]MBB3168924.1 PadR family transcriptional regulator PadR [Simiduia aestuariiviva]